jgi:hypothetical protein
MTFNSGEMKSKLVESRDMNHGGGNPDADPEFFGKRMGNTGSKMPNIDKKPKGGKESKKAISAGSELLKTNFRK